MTLQNAHIVVAGGSRGIGLAVAKEAAAKGARVTLIARDRARVEAAAKEIGAAALVADIADAASVQSAFAELAPVNHVFVAAGQFVGGDILSGDLALFRSALDARVWGAVHIVRALAGKWAHGASIVLTGGVSTDRPAPAAWATSIATAAAEQLARTLSLALAPVRCNAIAPGWTDTPMWDEILGASKADTFGAIASKLLVQRIATADEAASAVLFLMENGSVTGEVLHVDGGMRLT